MALHLQTTVFGQLVRLVSCGRCFQYPDERDSALWKGAVQVTGSAPARAKAEGQNHTALAVGPQNPAHETVHDGENVLIVGWYGPDDPEVRVPPFLAWYIRSLQL